MGGLGPAAAQPVKQAIIINIASIFFIIPPCLVSAKYFLSFALKLGGVHGNGSIFLKNSLFPS
jgi:hypothetical protein